MLASCWRSPGLCSQQCPKFPGRECVREIDRIQMLPEISTQNFRRYSQVHLASTSMARQPALSLFSLSCCVLLTTVAGLPRANPIAHTCSSRLVRDQLKSGDVQAHGVNLGSWLVVGAHMPLCLSQTSKRSKEDSCSAYMHTCHWSFSCVCFQ